jgi:lipopolysaccharide/colanic/teichoic acid biosynthesis glycosyltransferase
MKKRLLFHLVHFLLFNLLVFTAVYIYYAISYPSEYIAYSVIIAYKIIMRKLTNFLLVSLMTYFLCYVSGLIKYTIEDRFFRLVGYFREMFKFLVILAMVSFVEFFLFYTARIGRLIYVYIFILYGLYYMIYMFLRADRGPRGLVWRAAVPVEDVFNRYLKKPSAYRILTEEEAQQAGPAARVIYQDGHVDDITSEVLIKDKLAGLGVMELAELVEKESGKIPLDYVNIHWFLEKFDVVDRNYFRSSRMFNILMSLILIIILFPLGFLFALAHKVFSRGPVFYIQERTGLHGRVFKLIKFRTMVKEAEKEGARFSGKDDPRITPIGKVMRRLRLDEIPQFWNVLKGDMSLVGPRPEREVFIDSLTKEVPYYKLRLLIPPGITGWAQVNGVYAGSDLEDHKEKLEYDLYYIKNRSIIMDLLILLRTVKTIILAKGE